MLTLLVWLFQIRILPVEMYSGIVFGGPGHDTFWSVFSRNPYCLVDPTCMNPVRSLPTSGFRGVGFAQNEFESMNVVSGFAWSNYVLFMLLLVGITILVVWLTRKARWARLVLIDVICALCVAEVNRWFANVNYSVDAHAGDVLLFQYIGLTVLSLMLVLSVALLAARVFRSPAGGSLAPSSSPTSLSS